MLWRPSRPRARGHACRGAAASPGLQLGIGNPQTFGTKPHQGHPIPSEQKGNPGFVMAEFFIEEVKLAPPRGGRKLYKAKEKWRTKLFVAGRSIEREHRAFRCND